MPNMTLYHGAPKIVRNPEFGKGRPYNDYGRGFYCTENIALAGEWACGENADGFVNQYEINPEGLHILNLSSEQFTILHWLALLVKYRRIRISTPVMKRGVEYRAFVGNEISLHQLSYAMKLGELGEQFVLKSEKAFASIRFISCEEVSCAVYFPKRKQRDDAARAAFRKELDREDLDGLFIRDIVRGRILPDDPRLR